MAHYEQIGRKSVVNSLFCPCKPNKIKGLVVQGLHRRDTIYVLEQKSTYPVQNPTYKELLKRVLLQKSTNPFKSRTSFGILIGIFGISAVSYIPGNQMFMKRGLK